MCVRSQKSIGVGIDEHPYRQAANTQENLRRRFVLAVEDLEFGRPAIRGVDPTQRDVKLGQALVEFLDEFLQIAADCSWVHVVVVMQILDGQIQECVPKVGNLILVDRRCHDVIALDIGERRL